MRKDKDVLVKTVEETWLNFEGFKLANIWDHWYLVFDLITENKGGGKLSENRIGKLF